MDRGHATRLREQPITAASAAGQSAGAHAENIDGQILGIARAAMSPSFPPDTPDPSTTLVAHLRAAGGDAAKLSKEQKQFNQLVKKVDNLRRSLGIWHEFVPLYEQQLATKIRPLHVRVRERHMEMARLLDRAIAGPALSKRQRTKAIDLLLWQLSELLDDEEDPALVGLYDKYSTVSFADHAQQGLDVMRSFASDVLGVELDDDEIDTPAELAAALDEAIRAQRSEQAESAARKRRKSAQAVAQEAQRAQAADGASRAVREIYRKLASELHPDREPDAAERQRKTALMQQVNLAYAASDLLTLLGLQLSIEQIDASALTTLARDRLLHYNLVLKDQVLQLEQELEDIKIHYEVNLGERSSPHLVPTVVSHRLDEEARELKRTLRQLDADLVKLGDIERLKAELKYYRVGQYAEDNFDPFADEMFDDPPPRRRRR